MANTLADAVAGNAIMTNKYIPFCNQLEVTLSADGNTSVVDWIGGEGFFVAQGTFGGGTLTLKYTTDGGTTYTAVGTDTTLTASGGGYFTLPLCSLRATLAGSTSPSIAVKIQADSE